MKKLGGIICDSCRILKQDQKFLTKKTKKGRIRHYCIKCLTKEIDTKIKQMCRKMTEDLIRALEGK